jgi:hypothetical protein
MKHTIQTLEAALKVISKKYKGREAFNRAVARKFPFINGGAFRQVYDGGDYIIKVVRTDNPGGFEQEEIDEANVCEAQNYCELMLEAPAVAFFVLAPIHLHLSNGHDAVLMRKVSVISTDKDYLHAIQNDSDEVCTLLDYAREFFPKLMLDQYNFIRTAFHDAHADNIGWDMATGRVWFIDYNHGANCCERSPDSKRKAKRVMKSVIRSSAKAKAAA